MLFFFLGGVQPLALGIIGELYFLKPQRGLHIILMNTAQVMKKVIRIEVFLYILFL